jgi:peptidoglycan/LPS O-acetylase OafA/YrhL
MVGIWNGLLLGYLLYRSELVPKGRAVLGMVAGTLLTAAAIGVLLGVYEAGSAPQIIATAPEFVWELFLGIYLTFKGFRATGLRKLGFETGESAPTIAVESDLRSVA